MIGEHDVEHDIRGSEAIDLPWYSTSSTSDEAHFSVQLL